VLTTVCKAFRFDAAHYLSCYEGKCANMHGHGWVLEVEVSGLVGDETGMVIDFVELKKSVNTLVIDVLDHKCLNDLRLPFSSNPTCERILHWVWYVLNNVSMPWVIRPGEKDGGRLCRLRLYETSDSFAELKL